MFIVCWFNWVLSLNMCHNIKSLVVLIARLLIRIHNEMNWIQKDLELSKIIIMFLLKPFTKVFKNRSRNIIKPYKLFINSNESEWRSMWLLKCTHSNILFYMIILFTFYLLFDLENKIRCGLNLNANLKILDISDLNASLKILDISDIMGKKNSFQFSQ